MPKKKIPLFAFVLLAAGLSASLSIQSAVATFYLDGTTGHLQATCATLNFTATPSAVPKGIPTPIRFSWTQRNPGLIDSGEDITNLQTGLPAYSTSSYVNPVTVMVTINTDTIFEVQVNSSQCSTNPVDTLVAATSPVCGNGIKETGETCDYGALNGTCPSLCSTSCTPNTCTAASFDQGSGTISAQSTQQGTYSIPIIVTGKDSATKFITSTSGLTMNVTVGPSSAGAANVSSTNFMNGGPVLSSWDVLGTLGTNNYASNNVTQATYPNIPLDTYTVAPVANSAGTLYALHGVENRNVALDAHDPRLTGLFGVLNWLVPKAEAYNRICGALNTSPLINYGSSNPCSPLSSLSPNSAGDTANFVILWDPLASISLGQSAMTLDSSNLNGSMTIINNGAQGSVLSWNTSIAYMTGSGWLTLSPASNSSLNQGVPQTVNVSVNPAGLALGSYKAVVTFSGTTASSLTNGQVPQQTLTVTFNVTGGGPVAISIIPTPPTVVAVGVPAQVSCTGGSGSYTWSSTGPATFSPNTSASGVKIKVIYTSPSSPTYTVTCTEIGGSGLSASTAITVTPPCAISASPTKVIPPQSSTLTWSCSPGTAISCTVNGSATVSGTPVGTSGSASVTPTQNSTYLLSCIANNGLNTIMSSQTMVTVQGPGVIETNP